MTTQEFVERYKDWRIRIDGSVNARIVAYRCKGVGFQPYNEDLIILESFDKSKPNLDNIRALEDKNFGYTLIISPGEIKHGLYAASLNTLKPIKPIIKNIYPHTCKNCGGPARIICANSCKK